MGRFCINCGSELAEGSVFCDNCGARVEAEPTQATQPQEQPVAPQPQPVAPQPQPVAPQPQPVAPQPQPVAPQPQVNTQVSYQQPKQSYKPAQPSQANVTVKKKSAAPIIIAIVITFVVVAGAAAAVYFFFLKPADKTAEKPAATTAAQTTEAETKKETEAETEKETEAETEEETTVPEDDFTGDVDDPEPSDFSWTTGITSAPTGAEALTDSDAVSGNWKAYICYTGASDVQELCKFEILAGDRAVTINVTPYKVNYDGKYKNNNGNSYSLDGSIDSGSITAFGTGGRVDLTTFYKTGSKQYGLGELVNPSGEKAYVYLVRP